MYNILAKKVDTIDYFLNIFNGAGIASEVSLLILVLYNVCWYPDTNGTVYLIVINILYMVMCLYQLLAVAIGSMLVNRSVSGCV